MVVIDRREVNGTLVDLAGSEDVDGEPLTGIELAFVDSSCAGGQIEVALVTSLSPSAALVAPSVVQVAEASNGLGSAETARPPDLGASRRARPPGA